MKTKSDSEPEATPPRRLSPAARIARRLMRAIYPEYDAQQETLAHLRQSVRKIQSEVQEHRRRSDEVMLAAARRLEKAATAEDLKRLRQDVAEMSRRLERQGRQSARLLRRGE